LFLARVNLLKYRLRLPGFELPASVDNLQKTFDARIAGIFAAMADRVDGRADHVDEDAKVLLLQLERAVSEYQSEQSGYSTESRMQTFLSLSRRIIEIARSLDQEMEYIEVAEQTHA
jgi:multidrug resistance protein MdtO